MNDLLNFDKIIDNDYINKVYNYYIDKYNLHDSCTKLEFNSKNNNFAFYSSYDKKIVMNLNNMIERFNKISKNHNLKDKNYYGYINLKIIQFLLHEIEHAVQDNMSDKIDNLEEILISCTKLNMDLWEISGNGKMYEETYIYNPNERMADINSYKKIMMILKTISSDQSLKEMSSLLKKEYILSLIRGYDENICPSEKYLLTTGLSYIWTEMSFYDKDKNEMNKKVKKEYSFNKRLYLGLPIDNREFKKISFLTKKNMI